MFLFIGSTCFHLPNNAIKFEKNIEKSIFRGQNFFMLNITNFMLQDLFQALFHTTILMFQIEFIKDQRPFLMSKTRRNQQ